MNILQVGTGFASIPPIGAYGTERTIHSISNALSILGHEVTVLDIEEKKRPDVAYKVEEISLRWRRDDNLPNHIARGLSFRFALKDRFHKLLKEQEFDIVNFHNQFSAWHIPLVQKYTIPSVYTVHNSLWYDVKACKSAYFRFKFFQDIRAMRLADTCIFLNKTMESNAVRYFGLFPERVTVAYNGITNEWFDKDKVADRLIYRYKSKGEMIVLNVARIAPYKNQLTLVKALPSVVKAVPNVRFIFAGPISDKSYYNKICRFLSESGMLNYASFIGEIPYRELPEFYSLSDVCVFPSVSEAMPTVTLEAMAKGKPLITSDIEPFREFAAKGMARTVPTFDQEALADAVIILLKNSFLRERMGQQARGYVKLKYNWESITKRIIDVYENITNNSKQK